MQDTINKLINLGGKEWKNGEKHRIYFNNLKTILFEEMNFECEYYKTGNICSATLNGERITNGKANKLLEAAEKEIFYDVKKGKFFSINYEHSEGVNIIIDFLKEKIK